jgi:hypothetical protein
MRKTVSATRQHPLRDRLRRDAALIPDHRFGDQAMTGACGPRRFAAGVGLAPRVALLGEIRWSGLGPKSSPALQRSSAVSGGGAEALEFSPRLDWDLARPRCRAAPKHGP